MNNFESFTCYFCNNLINNETQTGHISLCSQVLTPCPYKCGSFIQRQNLEKHKLECVNNIRKILPGKSSSNSLDRHPIQTYNSKIQEEINKLNKKLEILMAQTNRSQPNNINSKQTPDSDKKVIYNHLKSHDITLNQINWYNGCISKWKQGIDLQLNELKSKFSISLETNKQLETQTKYIQQKLLTLQNLQMDLTLLKENVYKENSFFKKTEMDFARTIEELRSLQIEQNSTVNDLIKQNSLSIDNTNKVIENIKQMVNEQKEKSANLLFDLRAVSQISSEAAEKIEKEEREFRILKQDVNQLRIDMEILENLACSNDNYSNNSGHLLWKITEIELKLHRSKENDIVFKSPIFYTHPYGYKVRILLYLNGLNKWKDRYALACINVLKGDYDLLLSWPCTIEGNISLKCLDSSNKQYTKYIKTKRSKGDDNEEDEPQESSNTYIFIPHNILFKNLYVKDDTCFFDINLHDNMKLETKL